MLNRLLQTAMALFGFCGVALFLYAFAALPETIDRYEDLARMAQRVQVRLLSLGVRKVESGRLSNSPSYNYTPVGTFEIVGQEGRFYENVDLDGGTLRTDEVEAKQAAAHYREGMVLDAWFDPRSRNDPAFFPLLITDPAVAAGENRAQRDLFVRAGGASLVTGIVLAVLLLRR